MAYGSCEALAAYRSTVEAAAEGAKLPARLSGRVKLTSELVSNPAPPVRFVGNAWGLSPCVFSSGHLIASLSSKSSANRFLVNFQITNATIPINATPPATDRPIIVDVLTPLLSLSSPLPWSAPAVAVDDSELDETGRVTVTRMREVSPS